MTGNCRCSLNSTSVSWGGKSQYWPVLAFGHSKLSEQKTAVDPLTRNLKVIRNLFPPLDISPIGHLSELFGINQMRGSLTRNLSGHTSKRLLQMSQSLFGPCAFSFLHPSKAFWTMLWTRLERQKTGPNNWTGPTIVKMDNGPAWLWWECPVAASRPSQTSSLASISNHNWKLRFSTMQSSALNAPTATFRSSSNCLTTESWPWECVVAAAGEASPSHHLHHKFKPQFEA